MPTSEKDIQQFIRLGREVSRMMGDVRAAAAGDSGYCRRTITFPGGEVELLIASNKEVADAMEAGVAAQLNVEEAFPQSEVN